MNRIIYALTIIVLFTTACNEQPTHEKTIVIDTENINPNIFSALTPVDTITLNFEKDSVILGRIYKIDVTGNKLYVLDDDRAKALFIYDDYRSAKKPLVLHKVGNARNEYVYPYDFKIDKSNGNILIMDGMKGDVITYTSDGGFVKRTRLYGSSKVAFLDNGNLVGEKGIGKSDSPMVTTLQEVDYNSGEVVKEFFKTDNWRARISISPFNHFQYVGDQLCYTANMSNIVYNLSSDSITVRYIFDFGRAWSPDSNTEEITINRKAEMSKLFTESGYITYLNYVESEKFIVLFYDHNKKNTYTIVDKSDWSSKTFNDETKSFTRPLFIENDIIWFAIENEDMKSLSTSLARHRINRGIRISDSLGAE